MPDSHPDEQTHVPSRSIPDMLASHGGAGVDLPGIDPDATRLIETGGESGEIMASLRLDQRYEVGDVIAHGSMGAVLEARDVNCRRQVAMKVMIGDGRGEASRLVRFIEEAQVTAQLEHPGIVPVHELGLDDDQNVYYTMKYVRGRSLHDIIVHLRQGDPATIEAYPLSQLLTIFLKICDAMSFAHSRGVIHRDLKPGNVMIGDYGEVLVVDWGLAKILDHDQGSAPPADDGSAPDAEQTIAQVNAVIESIRQSPEHGAFGTIDGAAMGTPQYMSPEQARGRSHLIDHRTDVYALGGLLYCMLTLRPPVTGDTSLDVLMKVVRGEIPSPSTYELNGSRPTRDQNGLYSPPPTGATDGEIPLEHLPGGRIPPGLSAVVMKALALHRDDRYPDVASLQRDVRAHMTGFATEAEQASAWRHARLFVRRHRSAVSVALTVLALAMVLIAGLTVWYVDRVKSSERVANADRQKAVTARAQAETARADAVAAEQRTRDVSRRAAPEFVTKAQRLLVSWKPEQAYAAAVTATALDSSSYPAWFVRGRAALMRHDLSEARLAFESCVGLAPPRSTELYQCRYYLDYIDHVGDPATAAPLDGEVRDPILTMLSLHQTEARDDALQLIRQRLVDDNPGSTIDQIRLNSDNDNRLHLNLRNVRTIKSIESIRGLPLSTLDLSTTQVEDLSPLRGMPLDTLYLTNVRVGDIAVLRDMPLKLLNLRNTGVRDLSPLTGMPLEDLNLDSLQELMDLTPIKDLRLRQFYMDNTAVRDITPLAGMPLEDVNLSRLEISDISPVVNPKLRRLALYGSTVADLSPLRGSRLETLLIARTPVTTLDAVDGLPLGLLDISETAISDLSPLRDCPIVELKCHQTPVRNFEALTQIESLRDITIPKAAADSDLSPLRRMDRLGSIGFGRHSRRAHDFWAAYDAERQTK